MSNFDLIKMAFRNLFKRKLRTMLTMFSFIIGCACIVLVVSLSIGMNKSFDSMIAQMGNILVVEVQSRGYWNDAAPKDTPIIDDKAVLDFTKIKGVDVATPVMRGDFSIISGKYMTWGNIRGIDMSLYESLGYRIGEGRLPNEDDKYGVVMGKMILNNFYNPRSRNPWMETPPEIDPFEDKLEFNLLNGWDERGKPIGKPVELIVTALTPGDSWNDYEVFMDIADVKKLNEEKAKQEKQYWGQSNSSSNNRGKNKGYESALVKCDSLKTIVEVQDTIREMGYDAWSNGEWISGMQKTTASMQVFLGILGGITLFVSAIGIANTMFTAVYERTREIGIMKVIGATLSDIRRLFLTESAIIGLIGGFLGIGLSFLFSYLLNNFPNMLAFLGSMMWNPSGEATTWSIIPVWLCALALGVSTAIGIIAGYFPAIRATRLSALAAIRTE